MLPLFNIPNDHRKQSAKNNCLVHYFKHHIEFANNGVSNIH